MKQFTLAILPMIFYIDLYYNNISHHFGQDSWKAVCVQGDCGSSDMEQESMSFLLKQGGRGEGKEADVDTNHYDVWVANWWDELSQMNWVLFRKWVGSESGI